MNGKRPLGFFHSGAMHVPVFEAMVRELRADVPMRHVVRADLLARAQAEGATAAVLEAVAAEILYLVAEGAAVVLCTCSTLGPGAELAAARTASPVLRIDQPMVEQAVATGPRILIAAALPSTLGPTRDLVERVAAARGATVWIEAVVAEGSWSLFEAGDRKAYWRRIAEAVRRRAQQADVVILAQASMAGAVELLADLGIPILTSPASGVRRALELWQATAA